MKLNGTIEDNIWIVNPELKIPEIYNKLYSTDKSKDKINSSRILWGIYLIYHPSSKFFNLPQADKERLVSTDYLKDSKFKWKDYSKEIALFQSLILSPAKRALIQWNNMMEERTEFMNKEAYTADNWEMKDKMAIATPKLYAEYDRISKSLEEEGEEGVVKGGGEESANEKGLI